jgi:hypothetical protein
MLLSTGSFFKTASAGGGSGTPLAPTLTDTFVTTTNASTPISSGSKSLGAYATNRKTLISVAHHDSNVGASLTAVTCGGQSMTKQADMSTSQVNAQIWTINTGAGTPFEGLTSATFSFTVSATASNHLSMAVYSVPGMNETPTAKNESSSSSESVSANAGSATFAVAGRTSNTIGMSGVTVDYTATQGGFFGAQHGSKTSSSAETVTVTATSSAMTVATFVSV